MADFGAEVRVAAKIKRKKPYIGICNANFLSATYEQRINTSFCVAAFQNNKWNYGQYIASANLLATSFYSVAFTPLCVAAYQNNKWFYSMHTCNANYLFSKATALFDPLARVYTTVEDKRNSNIEEMKVAAKVKYEVANAPDQEVYVDLENPIPVVDSLLNISWRGTSSNDNDYVIIEYRYQNGGEWKDLSSSLNYLVADNGNDYVQPTFEWGEVSPFDFGETITYELVIGFDHELKNEVRRITDINATSYSLLFSERLETGLAYYWSIRAKDSNGDYSEYAPVKSFAAYQFQPDNILNVGGINRIIIPFKDYQYGWYVGNLQSGLYSYAVYKYTTSTGNISTIVPRTGLDAKYFIVDHESSNPPQIINVEYDEQKYLLKFDVKIHDSKFRKYKIKSIQYANQRNKVTGSEYPTYDLQSHNWKTIPMNEILGKKNGLESNPFLNGQTTFLWSFLGNKEQNKIYKYGLQVGTDPVMFQKNFKFAYRNHDLDGTPDDWVVVDFDYNDTSYWSKASYIINQTTIDEYLATPKYFGKANPNGIVMNKTKFVLPEYNGMLNKYDFRIFYTDINNPLINLTNQESSVIVAPKDFFDAGITNIILDLANIDQEYYELYDVEVKKILDQNSNLNFYWQVRVSDGYDLSAWSKAKKSDEFNLHHYEWYVRSDTSFGSSDYYVLKIELELEQDYKDFEYPKFDWLATINEELKQYQDQITQIISTLDDYTLELQSYYIRYVKYLQSKILQIRLRAYEYLLSQNMLADPVTYYNQNVHSRAIGTSDLDFKFNSITTEPAIKNAFNPINGQYEWSTAFYKLRIDKSASFDSQEGKPLREYKAHGRACKNSAYSKCYLTTGNPTSCKWLGILCPGFKDGLAPSGTSQGSMTIDIPPVMGGGTESYPNIPAESLNQLFDPGTCPMQNGGPCAKFNTIEHNMQERKCEVCEEPRYLEFITVHNDGGHGLLSNYNSTINPMGFASVSISDNNNTSIEKWDNLANEGEIRNPKHSFVSFELLKSQLPGEHNADILDAANQKPLVNSYFNEDLKPSGDPWNMDIVYASGWYPSPSGQGSKFSIKEII